MICKKRDRDIFNIWSNWVIHGFLVLQWQRLWKQIFVTKITWSQSLRIRELLIKVDFNRDTRIVLLAVLMQNLFSGHKTIFYFNLASLKFLKSTWCFKCQRRCRFLLMVPNDVSCGLWKLCTQKNTRYWMVVGGDNLQKGTRLTRSAK